MEGGEEDVALRVSLQTPNKYQKNGGTQL